MANSGTDYDSLMADFSKLATPDESNNGKSGSSGSASAVANMATLDKIATSTAQVFKAEQAKQGALLESSDALTKLQQQQDTTEANNNILAGDAASRIAASKVGADLQAQGQNIALRKVEGLSTNPDDILMTTLRGAIDSSDRAVRNIEYAKEARNTTLGSVIRGQHSLGDLVQSKFVKTEEDYIKDAQNDASIAGERFGLIDKLQGIYTHQTSINATAQNALDTGSARDAAAVAYQIYADKAHTLNKDAITAGQAQIKEFLTNSQMNISQSTGLGTLQDKIENSRKSWLQFADKADLHVEGYTQLVNAGRRFYNLSELSPSQIKALKDTPANKALLDTQGFLGANLIGAANNPGGGIPDGATGSPGETALMFHAAPTARLPQGMEQIDSILRGYMAEQPANIGGKPLTNADRAGYVNARWQQRVDGITDVDADPIFGKPFMLDVLTKAPALQNPTLAPALKIAQALGKSSQYVPMEMLATALLDPKQGLTLPVISQFIGTYATSAKNYVAVTRRTGLVGAQAPAGYKAMVKTGPMGISTAPIDMENEAARTDWLFRRTTSLPSRLLGTDTGEIFKSTMRGDK